MIELYVVLTDAPMASTERPAFALRTVLDNHPSGAVHGFTDFSIAKEWATKMAILHPNLTYSVATVVIDDEPFGEIESDL